MGVLEGWSDRVRDLLRPVGVRGGEADRLDPEALDAAVHAGAADVLERAWQPRLGYCRPNRRSYPHLWLWDSCFHAIAWFGLRDARCERGLRELAAVFEGQLPDGFVPHMRYGRRSYPRGPLPNVSSFTQPPVYVRTLQAAARAGLDVPARLVECSARALDALWRRRLRDGLLVIVHPWEAGTDDSPRWDDWVGSREWNRRAWTAFDRQLLAETVFDEAGVAVDNPHFVAVSASFNAIAADAAIGLGELTGDDAWLARGRALADALDAAAWDPVERLWSDVALVGGEAGGQRSGWHSARVPTLDGVLPALCTPDAGKAAPALAQLRDPARFAARYGPRFVPPTHPTYRPDAYWRGPAWPQLNYLAVQAALRWDDRDLADALAATTKRGCLRARFSEYWQPETGRGLGARPQTWSAVTAAL